MEPQINNGLATVTRFQSHSTVPHQNSISSLTRCYDNVFNQNDLSLVYTTPSTGELTICLSIQRLAQQKPGSTKKTIDWLVIVSPIRLATIIIKLTRFWLKLGTVFLVSGEFEALFAFYGYPHKIMYRFRNPKL